MFPMAAMNHFSELYAYNCMPFIAAIVGLGFGSLVGTGGLTGFRRRVIVVVGVLLLVSHGIATQSKTRMMWENGRLAWEWLPSIVNAARIAPARAMLMLVNPKPDGPSYSSFLLYGFDVLSDAGEWIRASARRTDLNVGIVDWDAAPAQPPPATIRLMIENGRVVPTFQP